MLNVLLVEDELLVRSGMVSLIPWEEHGYCLKAQAAHGKEALQRLEEYTIDIIITDIRMPVMDGLELIEQVRKKGYRCELIVLSSYDEFDYVRQALRLGVKDYIHKPTMSPQELIQTLNKVSQSIQEEKSLKNAEKWLSAAVDESKEFILKRWLKRGCPQSFVPQMEQLLQGTFMSEEAFLIGSMIYGEKEFIDPGKKVGTEQLDSKLREMLDHDRGLSKEEILCVQTDRLSWVMFISAANRFELKLLFDRIVAEDDNWIYVLADAPCQLAECEAAYEWLQDQMKSARHERSKLERLNPLIKEALHTIHQSYMDNLTLEQVSQVIHVSPVYLSRLFLKETEVTFIDYVTNFRMRKAKELLTQTKLRTYEISERVGYKNSKYFIRVFKNHVGMPPGEYRQQMRENCEM